jgi:acyl-CoA thioesterase
VTAGFDELLEEGFAPHLLPAHLGVEPISWGDGKARMRLPFRPQHLQNLGVVQGGIIATLADMTMAWAVLSLVHPRPAPTVDLTVSYLRPVTEQDIECEAVVLRAGRSVAYARADVVNGDGVLVASASASFLVRNPGEAGGR